MKIGILGTGDVGRALGTGFIKLGHEVMMGSREAGNPKAATWAREMGKKACFDTFTEAAKFGEVVVVATLGVATAEALKMAGPENFAGKVVIDTTNPLDFSRGMPPQLSVGWKDSLGEQVQHALPTAHVVKAFNTVGNQHMFKPNFPGGPPDMFICGEDEVAKARVGGILKDFGWGVADIGGIAGARHLEPMCMAWVLYGIKSGGWNHAYKLLRK